MNKLLKMMAAFVLAASIVPAYAERPTHKGADEFDLYDGIGVEKKQTIVERFNKLFDKPLAYKLLAAGSSATLYYIIVQRMNYSGNVGLVAHCLACSMGLIVVEEIVHRIIHAVFPK
jgi:hypothetical protein